MDTTDITTIHHAQAKLRHLMEQYGKVGKLFMKPEEDAATKKRKKLGGNKKKKFVEGWVRVMVLCCCAGAVLVLRAMLRCAACHAACQSSVHRALHDLSYWSLNAPTAKEVQSAVCSVEGFATAKVGRRGGVRRAL